MKVANLDGDALDYWVMKAEHPESSISFAEWPGKSILYSRAWQWGGPIIEREGISTWRYDEIPGERTDVWFAAACSIHGWDDGTLAGAGKECTGQTALIAAMRAYVASKFGNEVPGENI